MFRKALWRGTLLGKRDRKYLCFLCWLVSTLFHRNDFIFFTPTPHTIPTAFSFLSNKSPFVSPETLLPVCQELGTSVKSSVCSVNCLLNTRGSRVGAQGQPCPRAGLLPFRQAPSRLKPDDSAGDTERGPWSSASSKCSPGKSLGD